MPGRQGWHDGGPSARAVAALVVAGCSSRRAQLARTGELRGSQPDLGTQRLILGYDRRYSRVIPCCGERYLLRRQPVTSREFPAPA